MSGSALKRVEKPKPANQPAPSHTTVRLEYLDPKAKSVYVAGTFNEWHPGVLEMLEVSKGRWVKEITLQPGRHEYRLVVDGCWKTDPCSARTTPNPYGELNSVLEVPSAATNPEQVSREPVAGARMSAAGKATEKKGKRL